jgi:tetratricopeptide (TPR) repeat protein
MRGGIDSLRRGDRRAFVQHADVLLASETSFGSIWKTFSTALLNFGELRMARRAADAFAKSGAGEALFVQATIYARTGMVKEARAILSSVKPSSQCGAGYLYLRGTLALNDGDVAEAEWAFLKAALAMPASGQIWQSLSSIGSMAEHTRARQAILSARQWMSSAPELDRACYLYALGKTLADGGEYDAAYATFTSGAALIAATRPYNAGTDIADAATAKAWTAVELSGVQARPTSGTTRPIIVTGLPRSGSTLVEHILASHSAVTGGEELMLFSMIIREQGGFDLPTVRRWAQRGGMDAVQARYLHLFSERFGSSGRAVDKTLETSRYLGVIAAALPDAPLIWMRRRPLDNAWSCFRTYFLMGLGWTFSVEAIARHFKLEAEMLQHWQQVLGDRLLVVDYESLVADKEVEIPRILRHCGLEPEAQVFNPELSSRPVVTSSVTQVREPINTRAIDAVRNYPQFIRLFEAQQGV